MLFVLTLALILPVSAADLFQKDLKYGMSKNSEVKRLQQYLKDEKLYSGPISGNYYGLTQSAIVKLQKKYSIKPANGKFTKITRDKINSLLLAKEKAKQLIVNTDNTQNEAEQLAESIEALRQYEAIKKQQIQTPVYTPLSQPTIQQQIDLVQQQNIDIQNKIDEQNKKIEEITKVPEVPKKKATVKIQGNTHTKINVWGWIIDDTSYGKEDKTINYYINQNYPYKSVMNISINYGNPRQDTLNGTIEQMRLTSETKDFSCVKSGNEFWQGSTQSTVDGDSYIEPIIDTQKLIDNYMGKDLRFAVQCTNLDGTTSADYFILHITNEAK